MLETFWDWPARAEFPFEGAGQLGRAKTPLAELLGREACLLLMVGAKAVGEFVRNNQGLVVALAAAAVAGLAVGAVFLTLAAMQEMTAQKVWTRRGCSIVWSPELLAPLITNSDAVPLRTILEWSRHTIPDPPDGSKTVLVGGLQTVLEVIPDVNTAYDWLRENILPLCRRWCNRFAGVGLVFGMDGSGKLFQLNEADDLVYFGKGADRETKLCLTRAVWNGAATGTGVFKLIAEGTKDIGGFHVKHLS